LNTSVHPLRRWSASAMIAGGMPVEIVSRTLGHANSTITSEIYAHVRFDDIQKAYAAADPVRKLLK